MQNYESDRNCSEMERPCEPERITIKDNLTKTTEYLKEIEKIVDAIDIFIWPNEIPLDDDKGIEIVGMDSHVVSLMNASKRIANKLHDISLRLGVE